MADMEVIPEDECLQLLAANQLGRIAVLVDGQPQIFPVNYAIDGRVIAFRTAPGTKLERAPMTHVAFEIDGVEPDGVAWSVMAQGVSYDVTGAVDAASEAVRRMLVRPLAPGERQHWIAIHATRISGRRFRIEPG